MPIKSQLESLLFIAAKPLTVRQLAKLINQDPANVKTALDELVDDYREKKGGVILAKSGDQYQLTTTGDNSDLVQAFIKSEMTGELTKPSLETLTIIAYRGPIAKPDLEQIRGVNCSLILRNLMIRGLVETITDKLTKQIKYQVSLDFLRFLGVATVQELPDYEKLNSDENLRKILIV